MNLTKEYILSCYDKTKRLAKKSFEKGRYNRSLKYINIAARIAYQFNWIYRDDDLEELLANISKQTISKRNHYTPIENRYVLYVASMIDNRGEIQQYLRALIACEGELLVIVEKYGKEAAATIAEIKAYPKAKIYALQGDETDVESNAQKLYDKIVNFRPSKLFMHRIRFCDHCFRRFARRNYQLPNQFNGSCLLAGMQMFGLYLRISSLRLYRVAGKTKNR